MSGIGIPYKVFLYTIDTGIPAFFYITVRYGTVYGWIPYVFFNKLFDQNYGWIDELSID